MFQQVEKRSYHLRLQFFGQVTNHTEIKERKSSVFHHTQVARVRVSVKERVFKQLFKIRPHHQLIYLLRAEPGRIQTVQIGNLQTVDELHHQNTAGGMFPVNYWDMNVLPL